ncbi:MAG: FkbM family methyltransferase, partial [Cyanobacteria bacterium J06621_11]
MTIRESSFDKRKIEKASRKLNPHLIKQNIIDLESGFDITTIDPILLVSPERFDLIAKYVYALFWKNNIESQWGKKLYCNHIYAFNRYREGDDSNKIGKYAFLESFSILLQSIEREGFRGDISIVPVSSDHVLIDGAHRASACLAYGEAVRCLQVKEHTSKKYDYSYFLNKGMGVKYADYVAFQYCKLITNTYFAVVFPAAIGGEFEINKIFNEFATIVYEKEITLSRNGIFNLTHQIYRDESWCGDRGNDFRGLREKVELCFYENRKTRVFLIEADNVEKIGEAKAEIRSFFGIGKHSIYISDTHEKSNHLAQLLLNENSIHFLNNAELKNCSSNYHLFDAFRRALEEQNANAESFCIYGSFTMSIYGIRKTNFLGFLQHTSEQVRFLNSHISNRNGEIGYHSKTKDDLIFNPENHFYYQGIKFLSLDNLYSMKLKRGESKDLADCRLINGFESRRNNAVIFWALRLRCKVRNFFRGFIVAFNPKIKKKPPRKPFSTVEICSKILEKVRRRVLLTIDASKPFVRTIKYKNIDLYYSKGTSIVEKHSANPVRFGGTYELLETIAIVDRLKSNSQPVLIDVGANIGLISINVLDLLPTTKIYAFEPGPHQYSLFKRTIDANALENKIVLSQKAIGKEEGTLSFAVHNNKHSSGDG